MAKYRVTEAQLQKIFEDLEMKRLSEYDNYNYPAGADADPNAPWNQKDDNYKEGEYVSGNYEKVSSDRGEYLLKDKSNNQLYYTINDVWENYSDGNSDDIMDVLEDYLDIQQEEDADEDGRYMSNASDWKDYINSEDILHALASYMNYQAKGDGNLDIVNVEKWQDGEGKFLLVTPETIGEVMSDKLKADASKLLGLNNDGRGVDFKKTDEGLGKSLAAATALTLSTMFSVPTKANTISNKPPTEFSTKIEKNNPDFYSAVLGYVDKYSDNMRKSIEDKNGDVIKYIAVKKELMKYCEAKRDNQTTNKLSDSALKLLEFIGDSLKASENIGEYVKVGQRIKHIN